MGIPPYAEEIYTLPSSIGPVGMMLRLELVDLLA
jgi:hypothetical protein